VTGEPTVHCQHDTPGCVNSCKPTRATGKRPLGDELSSSVEALGVFTVDEVRRGYYQQALEPAVRGIRRRLVRGPRVPITNGGNIDDGATTDRMVLPSARHRLPQHNRGGVRSQLRGRKGEKPGMMTKTGRMSSIYTHTFTYPYTHIPIHPYTYTSIYHAFHIPYLHCICHIGNAVRHADSNHPTTHCTTHPTNHQTYPTKELGQWCRPRCNAPEVNRPPGIVGSPTRCNAPEVTRPPGIGGSSTRAGIPYTAAPASTCTCSGIRASRYWREPNKMQCSRGH